MIKAGYSWKSEMRGFSALSDISGNVAITFSLVSATITAMAGGVIDLPDELESFFRAAGYSARLVR